MRASIISIFLLIPVFAFSQSFKEKELKTEIKEVTVFLSGAQIFETGNVAIPNGNVSLKIKDLSPYIDEKSIQVKAEGDFTILSVNRKLNYLNEVKKDSKIDSLKKIEESIDQSIAYQNARLDMLKEKQSLLNENKKLGSQNTGATTLQLKQALDFYENEILKIKEEEIKIRKAVELKVKEKTKIQKQLQALNEVKSLPTSEIEIRVNAEKQTDAKFNLTYIVSNAGWYPKYDIRVHDIKSPLQLTYKAEVFQNTGVDWKSVKLKFSNGDPNQSGVVPELNTWNLNYARNTFIQKSNGIILGSVKGVRGKVIDDKGEPLPGVSVIVNGTTIGTSTDEQGNYNLTLPNGATELVISFIGYTTQEVIINRPEINVQMKPDMAALSEVVVVGYGVANENEDADVSRSLQGRVAGVQVKEAKKVAKTVTTTIVENQTTVEIEIATPYSIKSNGDKLQVELKKHEIEALYQYYAIPKLDKDAFLIARVINWDQYNLLEGEANLYFEDAFVGRSILDAKSLQDTLDISLGRDRNITINRVKNEQFSKRKIIGSNTTETRGFKITVRNKKSQPIKLTLFDQIPVAVISEITVNPIELSKGQLNAKTGKITWELEIDAQQQKEINFQYEVKYPKSEKVILE